MDKAIEIILEYAKELVKQKVTGVGDCISIRQGDYVYISKKDVSLENLNETDIMKTSLNNADDVKGEYALHKMIYLSKEDISAICHCHPAWVNPIAECKLKIPSVADDMTQIVGRDCKTCENEPKAIEKSLQKRNSTLIYGDGCITTGRSMNEAYTCVLVLDKAAHCYVGSSVLKPNVLINPFEAILMNVVYKMKYSKKNQENLHNEEGN
ncbi:MAG: class II aldolase/adducin family protein [Clostridia bacterium]|nr:class II aldolase/adducin family protein [Clostridia bacterium]